MIPLVFSAIGVLILLSANVNCQDGFWEYEVSPADKRHDCGLRDVCPENATTIQSVEMSPEICRCDLPQCLRYGDCCWSLVENRTLSEAKNLWKCQPLEAQNTSTTYALMISECPESSRDEITRQLCEGQNVPPQNHTYLVDLPVYSSKTADVGGGDGGTQFDGTLYKNIYCARCHNEKNSHIVPWTMQLACNVEFTPPERTEFMRAARYVPGERLWQTVTVTEDDDGHAQAQETKCALKIAELREFEIQKTIPNVRYCPEKAIAICPEASTSTESAEARKLTKMCSSYAQYVMHREKGTLYKNPHCALCHEWPDLPKDMDETAKDTEGVAVGTEDPAEPTPSSIPLSCRRPTIATTFFKVRPGEAGAILPGAGLNFLFDFGLGSNKYVGYEMLCGEDEIWDYIRQKCGPMICKSGYVLQRGECVRAPLIEIIGPRPNSTSGGSDGDDELGVGGGHNRTEDGKGRGGHKKDDDPECSKYRILLHEGEYQLLEDPPNAISVLLPNPNSNPDDDGANATVTQILLQSEYEYVNETTISICAKYLHRAFKFTFSTTLNYLSLVSVGLSVIFSAFHIILYLLLPKLRNPPGRNLFCLTASLFIFQVLFLALFTHDTWPGLCVGSAIAMHYFSLAAFFWMNVMSFDMWRTFSCNSLLRRSHSTDGQKFVKYSVYAWTTPGLIVLTAVILNFAVPDPEGADLDVHSDLLSTVRPSYGENGLCWITQRLSLFIFFAVPVAVVVAVNIVLFSCTANAIFSQQKESSRVFKDKSPKKKAPVAPVSFSVSVDGSSVTSTKTTAVTNGTGSGSDRKSKAAAPTHATNRDKVRLMLYVNMALIMGLGWILGFASQFLATDWLRYPFVVVNGLQGTFIFFAFDFKRKIWRLLRDRLRLRSGGRLGRMLGLDGSTSSMGIGDTSGGGGRRGTYSNSGSGTRSSNLLSTASEDDRRRKISLSLKQ